MEKISINLLPPELGAEKKEQAKKRLIVNLSVILLVVTIIITASILGFELYQRLNLSQEDKKLQSVKSKIEALHEEEVLNFVLKNRLEAISRITQDESPQAQLFKMILAITPKEVRMLGFSMPKEDEISISADTSSNNALDQFFNNLTDPVKNEGKISKSQINTLSLGSTGRIKLELTINLSKTSPQQPSPEDQQKAQ